MFGLSKLTTILIAVGIILAAAAGYTAWTYHRGAASEKPKTAVAQGQAAVAAGQAAAGQDAARITDAAAGRDRIIERIHEVNRETILSAPGAGQALDPDLLRRSRLGLCRYPAYAADPDCAAMRASDPGQLPAADPAGAAPSP